MDAYIPPAITAPYNEWAIPYCAEVAPPPGVCAAMGVASVDCTCTALQLQGRCPALGVGGLWLGATSDADLRTNVEKAQGYCSVACGRCAEGQEQCGDVPLMPLSLSRECRGGAGAGLVTGGAVSSEQPCIHAVRCTGVNLHAGMRETQMEDAETRRDATALLIIRATTPPHPTSISSLPLNPSMLAENMTCEQMVPVGRCYEVAPKGYCWGTCGVCSGAGLPCVDLSWSGTYECASVRVCVCVCVCVRRQCMHASVTVSTRCLCIFAWCL